jgi:hypothetical protein
MAKLPTKDDLAPTKTVAQHKSAAEMPAVNAEQIEDEVRAQLVKLHRNRTRSSLRAA